MKTVIRVSLFLTIVALWAGSAVPLWAATEIFNNSTNDLLTRFNPGTLEVGDEILLASTERSLTHFDFEYWAFNTTYLTKFSGTVTAEVRFYLNNGTPYNGYARPGTKFYDSGPFLVPAPTARSTFNFNAGPGLDFPDGGLFIPSSDITWSVQFSGMASDDSIGVDLYSPPVVGQDYPDYWQNNGGWTMLTNGVAMDFGATMQAIVPEPSAISLSLLGGLGILTLARRLRRKD